MCTNAQYNVQGTRLTKISGSLAWSRVQWVCTKEEAERRWRWRTEEVEGGGGGGAGGEKEKEKKQQVQY